jgi:hypothetical protein
VTTASNRSATIRRDTARSKRFFESYDSQDASECARGTRIETTWTAWGTAATGSTTSDAIPANDRASELSLDYAPEPGMRQLSASW